MFGQFTVSGEFATKHRQQWCLTVYVMGAIVNGIGLHGGLIPFGATFLLFSDYERNALRMVTATATGLNASEGAPWGWVLVFWPLGVVGLACPLVRP